MSKHPFPASDEDGDPGVGEIRATPLPTYIHLPSLPRSLFRPDSEFRERCFELEDLPPAPSLSDSATSDLISKLKKKSYEAEQRMLSQLVNLKLYGVD